MHLEPYMRKQSDRGEVWRNISRNLNANLQLEFRSTERSCRDTFNKLMKEFDEKDKNERKASGIDAEYDELMQLCQDIKERIDESLEVTEKEKEKQTQEKNLACDMRQKAMETLGSTKKRKSDDDEGSKLTKSTRRKSSDTLDYLKETMAIKLQQIEAEKELKQRELDIREAELKQQQQQQQVQNQMLMQMMHNQSAMFTQLTDIIRSKNT